MQSTLMVVLAFHVLAAVFWAGSSFVIARVGGLDTRPIFKSQIGAALVTIATGGYLWSAFHRGSFGKAEQVLALGIAAAAIALAFQVAAFMRTRRTSGVGRVAGLHYFAAGLLSITIIAMAIARFL